MSVKHKEYHCAKGDARLTQRFTSIRFILISH